MYLKIHSEGEFCEEADFIEAHTWVRFVGECRAKQPGFKIYLYIYIYNIYIYNIAMENGNSTQLWHFNKAVA